MKDSVYNNILDSSYFDIYQTDDQDIGACA
jgi:hypothetical protein